MIGEIIQILLLILHLSTLIPSLPRGCKVLEKAVLAAAARFLVCKSMPTVACSNYRLFSYMVEECCCCSGWHKDRTFHRSHTEIF